MNWFQQIVQKIQKSGGLAKQGFLIANAEKLRDEDPKNFSIPRSDQRKSRKVGDQVKIIIEATNSAEMLSGERPWVEVVEVKEDCYEVRIDDSLVLFPSLNESVISIKPENIIAVILPDEYKLPFGKYCMVSKSITSNNQWPFFATRLSSTEEGDSGWRLYAETEAISDASEKFTCDSAMGQFRVLDSILDEPELQTWKWNKAANEFVSIART